MISSEVQRTLVKSPPELWSELSDPDALARHLGELGEIKITRVQPENLVEWEAEGTTGTVEITPSGWGTRVTLTVSRSADAAAAPDTPEACFEDAGGTLAAAQDAAAAPVTPEAGAEEALEADGAAPEETEMAEPVLPGQQTEPETADPAARAAVPAAAAPGGANENEPDQDAHARKPAPATEAARRAAGWPSAPAPPGPAIESDLRAAEALDGPPSAPAGVQEWAAQALEDPANQDGAEQPLAREQPAAEPRRGFFARLFGRRRRPDAPGAPLPEPGLPGARRFERSRPPAETEDAGELGAPAETEGSYTQDAGADVEESVGDAAADDQDAIEAATDAAPGAAMDPERAIDAEAGIEHEREAEREVEVHTAAGVGSEREQHDTPEAEAEAARPAADTDHAPSGPAPAGPAAETDPAGPEPEPSAAEEPAADVATEQVQAVLEAVLDRLGAAHHRPFSRP